MMNTRLDEIAPSVCAIWNASYSLGKYLEDFLEGEEAIVEVGEFIRIQLPVPVVIHGLKQERHVCEREKARERERGGACVCVREREGERESRHVSVCVCVCVRERERTYSCKKKRERERERERESERERERESARTHPSSRPRCHPPPERGKARVCVCE